MTEKIIEVIEKFRELEKEQELQDNDYIMLAYRILMIYDSGRR